jgi:ketosteroid isomerase-like protein
LCIGAAAVAQPSTPVDEILQVERHWAAALVNRDLEALRRLYADDLVYVHSNGRVESKTEILGRIESGDLRYHKVDLIAPKARLYGGAAVVNGSFDASVDVTGRRIDARVIYIHVYSREGSGWRLVAHQVTLLRAR